MILTAVIARLREKALPTLVSIEGAEELEALAKGVGLKHGAAFVLPFEERAEGQALASGGFRQRVDVLFLVAAIIRKSDDPRGTKRVEAVDLFQGAIEGALAGWAVDEHTTPAELVAARAAPAGNGVTLYVQTWRTDRWIEA